MVTFEERDAFLRSTHSVVDRAVLALNKERIPLMNRILHLEWLKKRTQGGKVAKCFKPRSKTAVTISQLATLIDKTKTAFEAGETE